MFHRVFAAWNALEHSVRTGEPGFKQAFGKPVFELVASQPELGPIVDAAMTAFHGHETAAMLDVYDFSTVQVLADIGGGNGSLIESVLRRYPDMRGILFDLPHVGARTRERLEQHGLGGRRSVLAGSFFETIPAGADAYLFRHILHDWTDEQCVQILGHCRKVIAAKGRLIVVECVVPEGNERSIAKDFDITMMNFPGGIERTRTEFGSLFKRAGFELTWITSTATMVSVIEGRPS